MNLKQLPVTNFKLWIQLRSQTAFQAIEKIALGSCSSTKTEKQCGLDFSGRMKGSHTFSSPFDLYMKQNSFHKSSENVRFQFTGGLELKKSKLDPSEYLIP